MPARTQCLCVSAGSLRPWLCSIWTRVCFYLVHYNVWEDCWRRCEAPLGWRRFRSTVRWLDLITQPSNRWDFDFWLTRRWTTACLLERERRSNRRHISIRAAENQWLSDWVSCHFWRSGSKGEFRGFGLLSSKFRKAQILQRKKKMFWSVYLKWLSFCFRFFLWRVSWAHWSIYADVVKRGNSPVTHFKSIS